MPKATMLKSEYGSPDGIAVNHYKKGETYDLPDSLYRAFVEANFAEPYKEPVKPQVPPQALKDPETPPEQKPPAGTSGAADDQDPETPPGGDSDPAGKGSTGQGKGKGQKPK